MVDLQLLADLAGSEDECSAACTTLRKRTSLPDRAYLKPLFQRVRQRSLSDRLYARCLEVIHRHANRQLFAYQGVNTKRVNADLKIIQGQLVDGFFKRQLTEPNNGDMWAVFVLRAYAERYVEATRLLVDAVRYPAISLLVGSSVIRSYRACPLVVDVHTWCRAVEIYRETDPRNSPTTVHREVLVVHYGVNSLLAALASSNSEFLFATNELLEELITDRYQPALILILQAFIGWRKRNPSLVPCLKLAEGTFQGVPSLETLFKEALRVAQQDP